MRRFLAGLGLLVLGLGLLATPALAATAVGSKLQLRGHLPELGERPVMRVFQTQATYDSFRASLGDANVFPASSALFMSFDKDVLALYTRGNDTGGRCIGTQIVAGFSGDTLAATAAWQAGTCGAPSTAHYPFILVALSRSAADGTAWLPSAKSVCLSVESQDTNACASLSGASPAPTAPASPSPTTATTASPSATGAPTATRSLTPSLSASPTASPSPTATTAPATATRSPVAAASPTPAVADDGQNFLLYAMLIAIGFLVLLSLFLSRGGRRR